mmetsp:Transcript_48705/g.103946  ORF Transcript_48705/g.103946 Transcript_48705/m.103946 type:complete len:203 (-) Transcript_48705:154-762(-)
MHSATVRASFASPASQLTSRRRRIRGNGKWYWMLPSSTRKVEDSRRTKGSLLRTGGSGECLRCVRPSQAWSRTRSSTRAPRHPSQRAPSSRARWTRAFGARRRGCTVAATSWTWPCKLAGATSSRPKATTSLQEPTSSTLVSWVPRSARRSCRSCRHTSRRSSRRICRPACRPCRLASSPSSAPRWRPTSARPRMPTSPSEW